jgi:hypothetical protein
MKNLDAASIISIFLILFILVCFWPFAFIWSINTLFGTQISFNFQTWLASVLLFVILKGLNYNHEKRK